MSGPLPRRHVSDIQRDEPEQEPSFHRPLTVTAVHTVPTLGYARLQPDLLLDHVSTSPLEPTRWRPGSELRCD